jgi:hypothetical protein
VVTFTPRLFYPGERTPNRSGWSRLSRPLNRIGRYGEEKYCPAGNRNTAVQLVSNHCRPADWNAVASAARWWSPRPPRAVVSGLYSRRAAAVTTQTLAYCVARTGLTTVRCSLLSWATQWLQTLLSTESYVLCRVYLLWFPQITRSEALVQLLLSILAKSRR